MDNKSRSFSEAIVSPFELYHAVTRTKGRTLRAAATSGAQIVKTVVIIQVCRQGENLAFQTSFEFLQGNQLVVNRTERNRLRRWFVGSVHGRVLYRTMSCVLEPDLSPEGTQDVGEARSQEIVNLVVEGLIIEG